MQDKSDFKADTIVLLLSAVAVLVAATLTMATISRNSDVSTFDSPDPLKRAEQAANAGVEAARWHIQCHGRTQPGVLPPRFFINGATYEVRWEDVDPTDSTVVITSLGDFSWGGKKHYQVEVKSRIKIDYLPSHGHEVLSDYYTRNRKLDESAQATGH